MAQKIDVPLPEDLIIGENWTIIWDAVDPVTGASVAGVKVSNANVVGSSALPGSTADETLGPFLLVPGGGFGGSEVT